MRINNPKSLIGYTRNVDGDKSTYNLATVGQLRTAIANLENDIKSLLAGNTPVNSIAISGDILASDSLVGIGPGGPGLNRDIANGYAWLNKDGKIEPSLLPALAITETHVITQTELLSIKALDDDPGYSYNVNPSDDVPRLLNILLKREIDLNKKSFQKGDIIIVQPDQGNLLTDETSGPPNPIYSGSYIITQVPPANELTAPFTFAKIAYTDSGIVSINKKTPLNSAGEVKLYLVDILKELYYHDDNSVSSTSGIESANLAAAKLQDTVYRLATVEDEDGTYRFGFINNSGKGNADEFNKVIPYAKLKEVTKLREDVVETSSYLANVISTLRSETVAASGTLQTEVDEISSVIGDKTNSANRDLSATIYAQTKQLRNDVDDNLHLLQETMADTNFNLDRIQSNVNNLHNKLNEKAVQIIEKQITWSESNVNEGKIAVSAFTFEQGNVSYLQQTPSEDEKVLGIVQWTYKYNPRVESIIQSDERILAVYDSNGEKIDVDLIRRNDGESIASTWIRIDTEYVGYEGGAESGAPINLIHSLIGQTWTLLIAKTIVGIDNNETLLETGFGNLID